MQEDHEVKPIALWLDDSVAQSGLNCDYLVSRIQEEAEGRFEIQLLGDVDEAIEFVILNSNRVFMFVQDSTRGDSGAIIPAWKKLRPTQGPDIGFNAHQGDFCTYVIDAFTPTAGAVFAGFSFNLGAVQK